MNHLKWALELGRRGLESKQKVILTRENAYSKARVEALTFGLEDVFGIVEALNALIATNPSTFYYNGSLVAPPKRRMWVHMEVAENEDAPVVGPVGFGSRILEVRKDDPCAF